MCQDNQKHGIEHQDVPDSTLSDLLKSVPLYLVDGLHPAKVVAELRELEEAIWLQCMSRKVVQHAIQPPAVHVST